MMRVGRGGEEIWNTYCLFALILWFYSSSSPSANFYFNRQTYWKKDITPKIKSKTNTSFLYDKVFFPAAEMPVWPSSARSGCPGLQRQQPLQPTACTAATTQRRSQPRPRRRCRRWQRQQRDCFFSTWLVPDHALRRRAPSLSRSGRPFRPTDPTGLASGNSSLLLPFLQ